MFRTACRIRSIPITHRNFVLARARRPSFQITNAKLMASSGIRRRKATLATDSFMHNTGRQQESFSFRFLHEFLRKPRTVPIPRWITPRHYQLTFSECFGHGSFVLVAISYAVDDFLMLRIIAVAGSTAMLFFTYFHPHGRVLWLPFQWNVLFILINSYRISKVYWGRYCAENMPQELMDLRKQTFYLMDPVDYYRLMRIAEIKDYKKGDLLVFQGEDVHSVRMVLGSGRLRALRDGKLSYFLGHGNFLSEAGIHAGLLLPGDIESCCAIVADSPVRIISWNRTELVHLMELHEGVRRSLKAILSWDIVRKLKSQRKLLASHEIDDPEEWAARQSRQTQHRYAAILHAILQNNLLHQFQKEINKYRNIHQIDDEAHRLALAECGWTVEEYELGRKNDEEEEDEFLEFSKKNSYRDWKWYLQDVYLRLFG